MADSKTMSKPSCIGLQSTGEAKVLSTRETSSCFLANATTAPRSAMLVSGLQMVCVQASL